MSLRGVTSPARLGGVLGSPRVVAARPEKPSDGHNTPPTARTAATVAPTSSGFAHRRVIPSVKRRAPFPRSSSRRPLISRALSLIDAPTTRARASRAPTSLPSRRRAFSPRRPLVPDGRDTLAGALSSSRLRTRRAASAGEMRGRRVPRRVRSASSIDPKGTCRSCLGAAHAHNASSAPVASWGIRRRSPRISVMRVHSRPIVRSPADLSAIRRTIEIASAVSGSPAPMTNTGRAEDVSHHSPCGSASPASAAPRSRLASRVVHSPGASGAAAASRRARKAASRSVHQGRRTSCPSAVRISSAGTAR